MIEQMGGFHRLFGYCQSIQGPMEIECELGRLGVNRSDKNAFRQAKENAKQWRLLLQVDSDSDQSDMMWGDAGRLYFWIRREDLSAANFENCWLVSQCY